MSLHNFPEGMAIGSGSAESAGTGLLVAVAIALRLSSGGMAGRAPFVGGKLGSGKAFLLALFSAFPQSSVLSRFLLGNLPPPKRMPLPWRLPAAPCWRWPSGNCFRKRGRTFPGGNRPLLAFGNPGCPDIDHPALKTKPQGLLSIICLKSTERSFFMFRKFFSFLLVLYAASGIAVSGNSWGNTCPSARIISIRTITSSW